MNPAARLINLLKLDRKDVYQIVFYATFAGVISLSLPLGIQAIINFIQSGRTSASWIVLTILVVTGVGIGGIMSLMQLRITENLQQKLFIRASFEFAYRLPKIRFGEAYNTVYPPALANRFFDTLTLQKGIAKMLLDFSAASLQIVFGIILLSLYHPFFILFGLLLLLLLYLIFRFSYRPGLESSLAESKFKYRVADWLQEIARNFNSFRIPANFGFAMQKNDDLAGNYLRNREKHFSVLQRQFIQLIAFKVIITAGLLVIGGYLVFDQQMNVGQFVAAEIVILLVINSIEKVVLGLETFYDVLTAVEKIGEVTDMDLEPIKDQPSEPGHMLSLESDSVRFRYPGTAVDILKGITLKVQPGERILLRGRNGSGKTTLIRILSGFLQPTSGALIVNADAFQKVDLDQYRSMIGTMTHNETPFEGTVLDNITFGEPSISQEQLRWALEAVQLVDVIKALPLGLDTPLLPEGKPLSSSNAQKVLWARAIVRKPAILFLEDPTDRMDPDMAEQLIDFVTAPHHTWTIIVSSGNPKWEKRCRRHITLEKGKVIHDSKDNHAEHL